MATGEPKLLVTKLSENAEKWAPALRLTILGMICLIAVLTRVFSVIRYESIIHEFDPWFNFRATEFLTKNGYYALWNWFDSESWYPIGRYVAGSLYPGLMTTSWAFFWGLIRIGIPVNIRDVCVFIAPIFSAFSALAAYNMTREITRRTDAGLFSALFVAVVPSYMSRSVAGSYDNEAVAIFALIFSIYGFLRSINTGRLSDGCFAAFALFYLIASWGGYAFVINLIPIFVLSMFIIGKLDTKIFVGYNVLYVLTTLWAMLVRTTGYNVLNSSEHLASHGVFIFLMVYYFVLWIKTHISKKAFETISKLILSLVVFFLVSGIMYIGFMGITKWSGRSMTLLDPTYAKNFIPIIASVSEHQATTWSSFFFDLHFLVIFTPVGLFVCLKRSTPTKLFISLYLVLSVYFASVMVRLLLVLAPAVSVLAGIGVSALIRMLVKGFQYSFMETFYPKQENQGSKKDKSKKAVSPEIVLLGLFLILFLSSTYVFHGTWSGAEAYSSPSVVMAHKDRMGNKVIIDDYREAYYWLRKNTEQNAKVMSWWDYGYQIAGMGNRTTIVDNNTWNFTHIAIVGLAMASPEEEAYEIAKKLDVDYVLVIFGAVSYYSGDDINKFLWMVRISGGVFPHIKEEDYYGRGQYRVDSQGSVSMLNCLMYKLSYYRYDELPSRGKKGFDPLRSQEIGNKGYKLKYFEEAFTSEHWIVRIFRVKERGNRDAVSLRSRVTSVLPDAGDEYSKAFSYLDGTSHKFSGKLKKKRTL